MRAPGGLMGAPCGLMRVPGGLMRTLGSLRRAASERDRFFGAHFDPFLAMLALFLLKIAENR